MTVCPSCGQENPDGFRFCSACGAPLAAEAPASVRKTVTVLFCDLVGSTALGERSDPEVLRELMGSYHAELRAILERHGGTVEKFVGDAAMAVFGIPRAHEDDALRALRAAAAIREAVARLGLEARTGVNTGEVVAGEGETLVTGDAVNLAARLEQAASPGEILLGEGTYALVREAVRSEPLEALVLKGKAEPVQAYRLLELLPDVPAFTRPIESPFVGREDELVTLERTLARAIETRSPQLATVVGPPGIGKSRLARELVQSSDARVLVGRCLSYGEGITYWPLKEVVQQVGDVAAVLGENGDSELAAYRIGAALGAGMASPEEIAWGFRKLFEALASEQPLILVLDDIHWAEPTLLDLIEYVFAFAHDAPLLLLCMARPDLFDLRSAWAAPKPNATLLTLEPLEDSETEALVEELGDVPEDAKARIVGAAEGNPLFVEQLLAMQAEAGNGELEIPPSIQALLAARIDRLEPEERALIERASIEGRLFHRGSVTELLPEPARADVGGRLLALVRKELIRPDRAELPGDDGFRFGHVLIRDAAYDSIPKKVRADLHERFADWLESRLGDDAPDEILGYHLEQAARYRKELGVPDDGVGYRAADKLVVAGRSARARHDARATANLFQRASDLLPEHDESRRALLVDLGEALGLAGEPARADEAFEEAVSLARDADDAHVEWRARLELSLQRMMLEPEGGADAALREAKAAIAAREGAEDHRVLAGAWLVISHVHLMRSQGQQQARALEHALEHARAAGDLALEMEIIFSHSGQPIAFGPVPVEEGLRQVEGLLESSGESLALEQFASHLLGHLWARLGRFDEAQEAIARWRAQLLELGRERGYGMSAYCAWDVCWLAEDWPNGERLLREGYEKLEQMKETAARSTVAASLAEALYRQGRIEEAERYSAVSEELGASDDQATQMGWRAVRAKVLATRGELEQAESLAREAVEIAAETDYFDQHAGVLLDLAEVLRAAAKPAEARTAVEEAVALYERKGNLVGVARANAVLAEL